MAFDGRLLAGVGVLAAIVEGGSFVRAAEALGITASGISRAVARLEARVGVRLLDRTTRSVTLTDEGRRFYEQVGPLLVGIEDAAIAASGASGTVRGRLRVDLDPYFSRLVLAGHFGRFLERHPALSLELTTRERAGDLVADGIDVAMRFGEPLASSPAARKLIETRILTVASPAYLERHGRPKHPNDLTGHACIQFRNPATDRAFPWEFHKTGKMLAVKTTGRLLLSDVGTMLGECVAGTGVAQVMALGMQDLIDQGRLVELFPDWPGERFPLYALHPSRHLPPAKVRAFIDFILQTVH
ncbi:MAG TPA: LysR family transcriptional regulator [Aliidongia sp.]|uniref:LysR family transcriptional regulator n=1 Tax=Aliidongia sp. TaxID=1914230 RepID=UPI002DDD3FBB|nr:LysR family transcriptional regulator [Aliidongia sp.]HEV2672950.1 LysR family transcriptional regulator [Aliidongia sp.]